MKQLLRKSILCGSAAVMTMAAVAGTAGLATVTALAEEDSVPSINEITLGEDYQDITASITVLTNRTDIADTTYAEYAEQFSELYPNITVTYDAITDYEESLTLRLITGDWGDICFIPTSVDKDELSNYFLSFGDYDTLSGIYNFLQDSTYSGEVYGIANGGTATGIVYNKRIWEEAGIEEMPTTPEEFLEDLQLIADNTDSIPLYTNFAASWTMGQWDAYIGIAATGDADYMNNTIVHTSNPFSATEDMTGPYAVYYVLYEAVARGLVEEDPASTDWESSKSMMNSGEIATMVLGSWAVEQCKEVGDNGDDVGYMPFPITVDGVQYASAGGNYAYGINVQASTDNQIASMLYVKWLLEESTIFDDEGSIPALIDGEYPDYLEDFEGVTLLSDNAALEGEETLFDDINNDSEVGINNNDYPDCEILEAALYGTYTLDEIMDSWNAAWTASQEKYGVEIYE
ncbi:MAG: ABC transporter substrate-binding protein [Lachnospiraceae bacterium]|nr:ABC transporter substrate-binding protein [Lachnospiraceae bacterium]